MKKRIISLALAALLVVSVLAACGGQGGTSSSSSEQPPAGSSENGSSEPENPESTETAAGPDDTSTPYSFTIYANYDWWAVKPWGADAASAHMKELFNVDIQYTKPDADPAAKLNIMASSGDMPDSMIMERNADLLKIARLGLLQDLAQYKYPGNTYDEIIPEATQEFLKIDGKVYGVPNWAIYRAGGGNSSWNINQQVWKAVGSPELKTLEDLHSYAVAVRDAGLTTPDGESVLPFLCYDTADGMRLIEAFYRSMGGHNYVEAYFTRLDGKMQFILRDGKFKSAIEEANRWFNEGLFSETIVTDTGDQVVEKLVNGRPAMAYYDFAQDSVNHFRQLLMQGTNGENSYEILTDPIFPPAKGVDKVFGEYNASCGWNVNVITTSAENPQRIFDLYSWMLTKEGSINMMYGPQGGLWEELDENGNPILKVPEARLTAEEKDAAGCWFWAQPAHSDNVNDTKYAVNAALPPEDQDWTVTIQDTIFTPKGDGPYVNGQKFITDEDVGLGDTIDPTEDLGIQRKLILDTCKAEIPKMIFAKSSEELDSLYESLLAFAEENGISEIEERYDAKHQENCAIQGGSFYDQDKNRLGA